MYFCAISLFVLFVTAGEILNFLNWSNGPISVKHVKLDDINIYTKAHVGQILQHTFLSINCLPWKGIKVEF